MKAIHFLIRHRSAFVEGCLFLAILALCPCAEWFGNLVYPLI
jgi:hypothetical protein